LVVLRMEDGERRMPALVGRLPLRVSKGPRHVPLPERTTGSRAEHEVRRLGEPRPELVMHEHHGELLWDRHRACRSVRLRCLSIPVAVDLVAELELGVIEIGKTHVCPGQREELR